ncbi:Nuclear receptor domain-containing protein [Caenorhabditis elegans]|uniref:Nuclear receptor domain-containing protein n=1 Tax=Caenorhabditis elegans TaxID=6239 RepID=O16884_CAEEL|nr:Nuclear receptor domain-containing protein [Caenorhabditis elegans]CCD66096.3 Nuclear receptor domain-containing protein [Caenorhabditis elegans]|eukprot:NP_503705.3 Serpentine Receptor, class T [Caenorhabditis elegans]
MSCKTAEASTPTCLVCGLSCRTHFHFGGASCSACASFFRRTVSLNISYLCKRDSDCISSPELRSICRACRYQRCIDTAGMSRDLVQQRRSEKRTPKYVLALRNGGEDERIVRDYTTNSYTTLHEIPQAGRSETLPDKASIFLPGFEKVVPNEKTTTTPNTIKKLPECSTKEVMENVSNYCGAHFLNAKENILIFHNLLQDFCLINSQVLTPNL